MPSMTLKDFGNNPPRNAADIIQAVNNLILYREESDFWSANPSETDNLEVSLIIRCVNGDRTGDLSCIPSPIY